MGCLLDWLNLHISVLDSPECLRCDPVRRATWIWLLRYCIGQENGGTILGCKAWGDTTWQQMCRVRLKEVTATSPLWLWKGDDLLVAFYPVEREAEVQAKRAAGKRGGRPVKNQIHNHMDNHMVSLPGTICPQRAETEGKRKGIGKEGEEESEGKPEPSPTPLDVLDGMDRDQTPIELAKPMPMEINWRDWRSHHGMVHVAFRGEDGCAEDWDRIFQRFGPKCLDVMYTRLLEAAPSKRIYYPAALAWLGANTREKQEVI